MVNETVKSIKSAIDYLVNYYTSNFGVLPEEIESQIGTLSQKLTNYEILYTKSFQPDLEKFKADYKVAVKEAIKQYNVDQKAARLHFLFAMTTAFANVFVSGWVDGGGTLPVPHAMSVQLNKREEEERQHIDDLFIAWAGLQSLQNVDLDAWMDARAGAYGRALDGVYNIAKMNALAVARPEELYTLTGPDGTESCATCQQLKTEKHPMSWWIKYDFIPYQGNNNFDCKGWRCMHEVTDSNGNAVTLPMKHVPQDIAAPVPSQLVEDPKDAVPDSRSPKILEYAHGIDIVKKTPMVAWIVDGNFIRTNVWQDWISAGNYQRYPWIPEGEYWLDIDSTGEYDFDLIHETVEDMAMRDEGLSYDEAHSNHANPVEWVARHDPERSLEILRALGWQV